MTRGSRTLGWRVTAFVASCSVHAILSALLSQDALATNYGCQSGYATHGSTGGHALNDSPWCQSFAKGGLSLALGQSAQTKGNGSVGLGTAASANGPRAIAVGYHAGPAVSVEGMTTIGAYAAWDGAGIYSTAIGSGHCINGCNDSSGPHALGAYSIAIGAGCIDFNNCSLNSFPGARATTTFGIALGTASIAAGERSVSVGAFAGDNPGGAGNNRNSAFGTEAGRFVTGGGNTATGLASGYTVTGDLNSGFGNSAGQHVSGNNNTAAGVLSGVTVNGHSNSALGNNAGGSVTGHQNVALGAHAGKNITASDTISIGTSSRATANAGIAIGFGAVATKVRAVAIGSGSLANVAETVSVGNSSLQRRIVNVAPGVNGGDAVNVAQLQAAVAAATGAPAPVAQMAADVSTQNELAALRNLVSRLETRLNLQEQELKELKRQKSVALNE
jgi:trimeric autotransporter adhesin